MHLSRCWTKQKDSLNGNGARIHQSIIVGNMRRHNNSSGRSQRKQSIPSSRHSYLFDDFEDQEDIEEDDVMVEQRLGVGEEEEEDDTELEISRHSSISSKKHVSKSLFLTRSGNGTPKLVEEVASRLKQAELRVIDADRQSRMLQEEVLRLRAALDELQQSHDQNSKKWSDEEERMKNTVECLEKELRDKQNELSRVRSEKEAAETSAERLEEYRSQAENKVALERATMDSQIREERETFSNLKREMKQLEAEMEEERKASQKKVLHAEQTLEEESTKLRKVSEQFKAAKEERENLLRQVETLREQKRDLESLLVAAKKAEGEAKSFAQEQDQKARVIQREKDTVEMEKKQLEARLVHAQRTIEDADAEREQLNRQIERLRVENNEMDREITRLTDNKAYGLQQVDNLRRQLDEAKDALQRNSELMRAKENKTRQENISIISRLQHENQLLKLDVGKAKEDLERAEAASTSTKEAAQAARLEVERVTQLMAEGKANSQSLAAELKENDRMKAKIQSLQKELAKIQQGKVLAKRRSDALKTELDRKRRETQHLTSTIHDLQTQLGSSNAENDELDKKHQMALKAKEAENSYVWKKLEQALQL